MDQLFVSYWHKSMLRQIIYHKLFKGMKKEEKKILFVSLITEKYDAKFFDKIFSINPFFFGKTSKQKRTSGLVLSDVT